MFCSDSGRGSSLLDRTIADRRQLNTITLPDFSDPETGETKRAAGLKRCQPERGGARPPGPWGGAPGAQGRKASPGKRAHLPPDGPFPQGLFRVWVRGGGRPIPCQHNSLKSFCFSPCSWSQKFETKIRLFPSPSSVPWLLCFFVSL